MSDNAAQAGVRAYLEEHHRKGTLLPQTDPAELRVYIEEGTGRIVPVWIGPEPVDMNHEPTDEAIQILIAEATEGSRDADLRLRRIAKGMLGRGLPPNLERYIADALEQSPLPRRRGKHASAYANRDACIVQAVRIAADHGLYPTRNEATGQESGCSVVAAELQRLGDHLNERGVAEIWNNRRDLREMLDRLS